MKRPALLNLSLTLAVCFALSVAVAARKAGGQTATELSADSGPQTGLAALYPGDRGIANDPAVVFCENFDSAGSVTALDTNWTLASNKDNRVLALVQDDPTGTSGGRSLRMTATKDHDTGGYLWKLLDGGYDQLYARFYVKFAADAPYVHHFVELGARRDRLPYPMPEAGSRPAGDNAFLAYMDLGGSDRANPPGLWMLYTYWCEMHSWQTPAGVPDGVREAPYYGNLFGPDTPEQAKRGEWQCVEFMIKCNSAPDKTDGEEAFWVDGRLVDRWAPGTHSGTWGNDRFHTSGQYNTDPKPFPGFRWRTDDRVKINTFWLEYYMEGAFDNPLPDTTLAINRQTARVQFDNIVLATRYIGPIASTLTTGYDYNGDGH
ncbi:hypothetical protein LLH00_05380, partial [bacterium]|nr:hypothetical protein [bacterium]